jgi:C_GCAxxG_C_C family probable redox protein
MPDNTQKALAIFRSGKNCAQAVLTAFSEELEFDNDFALALSSGFGGGMGRLQETCGAATGAFMVLGIYNSRKYADNNERKEHTYAMIQEFNKQFVAIHKTSNCRLLLGIDLKTDEGQQMMRDKNLSELVCEKCVSDSVKILEEFIKYILPLSIVS